ncbi:MAG: hypothetical protein ACHP6H_07565 [Legionellales bacterium]
MKRSIYMTSLILGLFAGQTGWSAEVKSDVESQEAIAKKVEHIKKTYPTLASIRKGGIPLLERWAEDTTGNKPTFLANLFIEAPYKATKKTLNELDAFMKEYADEIDDFSRNSYNNNMREYIVDSLARQGIK